MLHIERKLKSINEEKILLKYRLLLKCMGSYVRKPVFWADVIALVTYKKLAYNLQATCDRWFATNDIRIKLWLFQCGCSCSTTKPYISIIHLAQQPHTVFAATYWYISRSNAFERWRKNVVNSFEMGFCHLKNGICHIKPFCNWNHTWKLWKNITNGWLENASK